MLTTAVSCAAVLVLRFALGAGSVLAHAPLAAGLAVGIALAALTRRPGPGANRRALARLVESSPLGVCVLEAGTIALVNERLCRTLGKERDALIGAPISALARREDRDALPPPVDGTSREIALLRSDGSPAWFDASAAILPGGAGELLIVSLADAAARRDAEEQRSSLAQLARCQEEQLEHSTRLAELGEMAAAISHELNQPLTGIRNYARNAFYMIDRHAGGEEEIKENLRLISGQVDRAAKIINQMRELTKRSEATFTGLELNSVIRESVDFLMPQMKLSEIAVTLRLEERLPQVWGDRVRLAQVFLNLLSNARQATEGAAVRRLTVSTVLDAANPALPVVATVSDTGKGLTPEQRERLFQPFFTTRKGGHGLGLSISRAIVKDHGGLIEANGAPGEGASFTVRLPAAGSRGAGA
jgi:PAS domain S-box-containing protein